MLRGAMLSIRARLSIYAGLAFAGLVLVLLVTRRPPDVTENPQYDALVKAHSHALAARHDSTEKAVTHADDAVARTIVRYQQVRDTLNIHDTVQVRQFVARADDLRDSVTALRHTIVADRAAAADLLADKDLQIARAKVQPSRLAVYVSGLYDPIAQIPAASVDAEYRITANVSAVARIEQRFAPGEKPRGYVGGRVKV